MSDLVLSEPRRDALRRISDGQVQVIFKRTKNQFVLEGEIFPPSQISYRWLLAEGYLTWKASFGGAPRADVILTEKGAALLASIESQEDQS